MAANRLPQELHDDIISHLDLKDLKSLRFTNKHWSSAVSPRLFDRLCLTARSGFGKPDEYYGHSSMPQGQFEGEREERMDRRRYISDLIPVCGRSVELRLLEEYVDDIVIIGRWVKKLIFAPVSYGGQDPNASNWAHPDLGRLVDAERFGNRGDIYEEETKFFSYECLRHYHGGKRVHKNKLISEFRQTIPEWREDLLTRPKEEIDALREERINQDADRILSGRCAAALSSIVSSMPDLQDVCIGNWGFCCFNGYTSSGSGPQKDCRIAWRNITLLIPALANREHRITKLKILAIDARQFQAMSPDMASHFRTATARLTNLDLQFIWGKRMLGVLDHLPTTMYSILAGCQNTLKLVKLDFNGGIKDRDSWFYDVDWFAANQQLGHIFGGIDDLPSLEFPHLNSLGINGVCVSVADLLDILKRYLTPSVKELDIRKIHVFSEEVMVWVDIFDLIAATSVETLFIYCQAVCWRDPKGNGLYKMRESFFTHKEWCSWPWELDKKFVEDYYKTRMVRTNARKEDWQTYEEYEDEIAGTGFLLFD